MNYLLLLFALIDLALLVWTFSNREDASPRVWLIRLMLVGMFYDNTVQGIGNWFIDAAWYPAANVPRFFLHAAILPFLTLFGLSVMRSAGIKVASNTLLLGFCWVFTVCGIAWGLYHEVIMLELETREVMGVMKMSSASGLPPIPTILANIIILPMAIAVWRREGWPWFFLGALFIFLLNGATGAQPWGFLVGNFAEVVFTIALLLTHWHFSRSGTQGQ